VSFASLGTKIGCLIGRLLPRALASRPPFGVDWLDIQFVTSSAGRPSFVRGFSDRFNPKRGAGQVNSKETKTKKKCEQLSSPPLHDFLGTPSDSRDDRLQRVSRFRLGRDGLCTQGACADTHRSRRHEAPTPLVWRRRRGRVHRHFIRPGNDWNLVRCLLFIRSSWAPSPTLNVSSPSSQQLHAQEKSLLASLSGRGGGGGGGGAQRQRLRCAMLIWTHKESVSKALGTGLAAPFASFKVRFVPESFGEPSLPRRASVTVEDGGDGDGGVTTWEVESTSLMTRPDPFGAMEEHIVAVAFDAASSISRPWIEICSLDHLLQHARERPPGDSLTPNRSP
jgi:4'-phosphopantetheinyl transferase superfamily